MIYIDMTYKIHNLISLVIVAILFTLTSCNSPKSDLNGNDYPEEQPPAIDQTSPVFFQGGESLQGLPPKAGPWSLAFDNNDVLWIASMIGGVIAYYDGNYYVFDRLNTPIPDGSITAVFVDKDDVKWFGTFLGHIYTFDNKEWTIIPTPAGPYREVRGEMWVRISYKV